MLQVTMVPTRHPNLYCIVFSVYLPSVKLGCGLCVTLFLMLMLFVVYHIFWLELLLLYRSWFGTDEQCTGGTPSVQTALAKNNQLDLGVFPDHLTKKVWLQVIKPDQEKLQALVSYPEFCLVRSSGQETFDPTNDICEIHIF